MAETASERVLGELTFQDVSRLVGARSVLVLPVGSIEQHGPHLPLNTDVLIAEALAAQIVTRWADTFDLWRLPAVPVSLAREHEWAPGTLSLSVDGMTRLVHDLARTIRRSLPTRNLLILNAHGGNRGILEALVRDIRIDTGLNVCIFHPAALSDGVRPGGIPEIHGGKNETSIMLEIAPHLVRLDRCSKETTATPEVMQARILDPAVTWPWRSDDARLSDVGTIGDPHAATPAFGRQLMTQAVERAGEIIANLLGSGSAAG